MRIPGKDLGPFGGSNGKMAPNDGALFRLLTEWGRDATWVMDLSLKPVYMSPAIREQLGYSPEEYLSLSSEERLPPESLAIVKRVHADLMERAKDPRNRTEELSSCFEILQRHKDGSLVWVEVNLALIFDEDGEACGIHGVTRNIEERKRSERALRESEAKYRRLVELLPIGVFECDLEGRISYVNEALLRMLGYPFDQEYSKMDMARSLIADDWSRIQAAMSAVLAGRESRANRYTAIKRDGSRFPIEVHGAIIERDGLPKGFCGVIIDASDKKRAEDERLKTNKLEAVSLLAGGIAHDFNNILAAIMGNLSLAELGLADAGEPELAEERLLLREAEQAILRARDLTHKLLAFSKGGATEYSLIRPQKLINEIGTFNTTGSAIGFELEAEDSTPPIRVDTTQFSQLVQNLIINAVQAMPDGGVIRVRLSRSAPPFESEAPQPEWFRMDVDDSGPGIGEDIRERIFDPYFTTKPKGSGIGLAVCLAVARNHHGDISVSASPEGGARFTVFLPAADGEEAEAAEEARGKIGRVAERKPTHGLRLLFVDDEEALRRVAAEMGLRAGYRLLVADSTDAALELAADQAARGLPFQVALIDLTLRNGKGGTGILEGLRSQQPRLPLVVSSGYVEAPDLAEWKRAGVTGVLRKPYDMTSFVLAIEEAFEESLADPTARLCCRGGKP
jgi:PAS domain S-box-containing protein